MKILPASIIVILIGLTITSSNVSAQTSPQPNDLEGGNIFDIQAKNMGLPGGIMEINGNLVTKDPIKIMLSDPNGTIVNYATTFSDRNGDFTSELKMPSDPAEGTWKIIGTSGICHKELNFTITGNSNVATTCYAGNLCSTPVANTTIQHGPRLVTQSMIDSPLQQYKSGIAANDVKCKQGLQLVIRAEDNSPACVKPQTSQKLVERGWGWAMQPIGSLKPPLPNRIAGLENDTGIVIFGNRTYYFETPHYTHDAYVNPVHISFHGVVFTLFPSGFRGGLPAWGCGGSYYWTSAKFSDGTSELLHIFVGSQDCSLPQPSTYFSANTDPLAGLTFYDGKLKLLVSVEGELQRNNSVVSTPIPTNETTYHDFPHPPEYSIINSTQGIIVNDDAEASNLTGFSVKSPTDLPQGYTVKLIKASKEIPMVTIFVSKNPLTENTTSEDFLWNQQGILITYDKTSPHELENFNQLFPASANKIITINGTLVVVSDISKEYYHGYQYDMLADLVAIQNNDTNIGIRGFFHSDELVKIVTSMLEK